MTTQLRDAEFDDRYRCADGHDCLIPRDASDADRQLLAEDIAAGAIDAATAHCSNVHLIITAMPVGPKTRLARRITVTSDQALCTVCN